MTSGILLFAHNNREIDYGTMACVCARYAIKHLDVPVSLVTNSGTLNYLDEKNTKLKKIFDSIILTDDLPRPEQQDKRYYDGAFTYKKTIFNNGYRTKSYDLTVYDKTLVIDTDVLIKNDKLKTIWNSNEEFMINSTHIDLAFDRNSVEFDRVSEYSINFYWATAFYFEKTLWTKTFFDLCQHIQENYEFYKFVYQISYPVRRNDYIFSIAIHIMNGFSNRTKPATLPCDIYYTLDRDDLFQVNDDGSLTFLLEKKSHLGEFTLIKTSNQIVHIMNKYGYNRNLQRLLEVIDV